MKKSPFCFCLLAAASAILLTNCASAPKGPTTIIVWCGVDYSKVKMIGTGDFRQPDRIFPAQLLDWNQMFMEEAFDYLHGMEKDVRAEIKAVEPNNARARASQIERVDGTEEEMVKASHIAAEDIAGIVKSYELQARDGVGVVIIMDRMVKKQDQLCAYVVYFDVATRKVFHAERKCHIASKGSFRSHWFKPLKPIINESSETYHKLKAQGVIPAPAGTPPQ